MTDTSDPATPLGVDNGSRRPLPATPSASGGEPSAPGANPTVERPRGWFHHDGGDAPGSTPGDPGAAAKAIRRDLQRPDELSTSVVSERRDQRVAYHRGPPGDDRRRCAPLSDVLEIAANDAIDRDLRVIFLVGRIVEERVARHMATLLGAPRPFERTSASREAVPTQLADFFDAVDAALAADASAERDGDRIFIEPVGAATSDDLFATAIARERDGDLGDGEVGISARLAARRMRLIVVVAAAPTASVLRLLEARPDAYLLPWTDLWLQSLADRNGVLSEAELQREVGRELREAARIDGPGAGERELVLRLRLLALASAPDLDGFSVTIAAIRKAMDDSRTGLAELGARARARFERVVRSDDEEEFAGPIGRIILLVALLVPNRPASAILELCRHLLPDGPAHTSCLTSIQLQIWQRGAEDDRRLGREVRPPPCWKDLFDASRDRIIHRVGLVPGPNRTLVRGGDLAMLDPAACLREHGGRLMELARHLVSRCRATTLPTARLATLVDLALALHALDGGCLDGDDLVTVLTGMEPTDGDLAISDADRAEVARLFGDTVAARVRLVGDLTALTSDTAALLDLGVAPSDIARVHEAASAYDETLRIRSAGLVCYILDLHAASPTTIEHAIADVVEHVAERVPVETTALLLAHLVLRGTRLSPTTLGRITAEMFVGLDRNAFTSALRRLREVLGKLMGAAIARGERDLCEVDRWADALWAVADEPRYRPFGQALAIWLDDSLSTWEIPTAPGVLRMPPYDFSLLASLAIGRTGDERASFDLLCRLFRCTPFARIDALRRLAEFAGGPRDQDAPAVRVDAMIAQRIGDVFCILVDDVDLDEAVQRRLDRDHIDEVVWSTLSQHYRLLGTLTSTAAVRAILDHIDEPERLGRPDPRALLDLYAPAVLMYWRFRLFGAAPLIGGSPEYEALRAALLRVDAAIEPAEHRRRNAVAVRALIAVQRRLVTYFRSHVCPKTTARHEERLACWASIADFLDPPVDALVPLR